MRGAAWTRAAIAVALAGAAAAAGAGPAAGEIRDGTGAVVPGTEGVAAQLQGTAALDRRLADPFFADGGGVEAAVLDALGASQDPHDELLALLGNIAQAPDMQAAQESIAAARGLLEGTPASGGRSRAHDGLGLLNWDAPRKEKTVPADTRDVVVRQVRFDGHVLSDTARLRFADPDQPFTISYVITTLGVEGAGRFAPTPLLQDGGTPIGGQHNALTPLTVQALSTGTRATSRFTRAGALEETRLATQRISVRMPAPKHVEAILDPTAPGGDGGLGVLVPDTVARRAQLTEAFGFSGDTEPTVTERETAIGRLAAIAPERQLWQELKAMELSPPTLAQIKEIAQSSTPLVGVMRTRAALPPGARTTEGADVDVALVNDEAYVSKRRVRLPTGRPLRVAVTNYDGFAHRARATRLSGSRARVGADDWGRFDWSHVGDPVTRELAPGATATFDVDTTGDPFKLWVGDADLGEQGSALISLDRGPVVESLKVGGAGALPLHMAFDAQGRAWATLAGVDKLVRITPGETLGASQVEEIRIPGGTYDAAAAPEPRWGPGDVRVDGHGIVWATLGGGNAIARIDPALVAHGTDKGVQVIELEPCADHTVCRQPPLPAAPGALTRLPLQLRVWDDGAGNTVLAFTEMVADRIGILRVTPDGTVKNQAHFPCGCVSPLGLDLDADGAIWFTEGATNRIGRLQLGQARPYAVSSGVIRHFNIPSAKLPCDFDPELGPGIICSSAPHSIDIDYAGRVWFTQGATGKLAWLDPAAATPGTADGMHEISLPDNDFGRVPNPADLVADRAGTVFWTDEYGDAVGTVTVDGPGRTFRPAERQSLTDSPVVTPEGDLWLAESGSELITRVRGVSAGLPTARPAPTLEADTATGSLRGSGLAGVDTVDVVVRRSGARVAGADAVGVDQGTFAVALAVKAEDRVEVVPHGPGAGARVIFTIATLQAALDDAGAVRGHASRGGDPVGEQVKVGSGDRLQVAAVDPDTGAFTLPTGSGATRVTWTTGTAAATVRTVAAVAPAPAPESGGETAEPQGGGDDQPRPPAGEVPPPAGATAPQPPSTPTTGTAAPCPRVKVSWAAVSILAGATEDRARRCLGRPSSARKGAGGRRLAWGKTFAATIAGGRVTTVVLRGTAARRNDASLNGPLSAWRKAVPALRRSGRDRWKAILRLPGGRRAEVRLTVAGRPARVTGVLVALLSGDHR
ncbi:MAG: hypothetical protein JWN65_1811 [Solirubrobacterales bacterium]|nr:hypothetical protein [Solirubrobacterales bacterium]